MCRGGRRVHHILTLRNGCCSQLSKQYSFAFLRHIQCVFILNNKAQMEEQTLPKLN